LQTENNFKLKIINTLNNNTAIRLGLGEFNIIPKKAFKIRFIELNSNQLIDEGERKNLIPNIFPFCKKKDCLN